MADVYLKHSETGAIYMAPESAVPMLAQSGWVKMSQKDAKSHEDSLHQEQVDIDRTMTDSVIVDPSVAPPEEAVTDDNTEKGKK